MSYPETGITLTPALRLQEAEQFLPLTKATRLICDTPRTNFLAPSATLKHASPGVDMPRALHSTA